MRTMSYILLGTIFGLGLIWIVGSYLAVRNLEAPAYTVLEIRDGYEIREYRPYIVAEATVTSESFQDDLRSGFTLVADYIFGNNTSREKIAMTTPVLETEGAASEKIAMTVPVLESTDEDTARTIAFVLPSAYTMDTLPIPNNERVKLREVPGRKVAALSFTWYATTGRVENKKQKLQNLLQRDGVNSVGEPQGAFYNPPLSFPLTRRNEILIEIE